MSLARPKPQREQDRAYRAWIGELPCIACACEGRTSERSDCAHVSFIGSRGLGSKVSDRLTAPLCRSHHTEQHNGNERLFWARLGVNPRTLTGLLSEAYDAGLPGKAIIASLALESRRTPRLVPASALSDRTHPAPAAPPRVTLTGHLSAETDGFGNRAVILPTLGQRGRGTSIAYVDPDALGCSPGNLDHPSSEHTLHEGGPRLSPSAPDASEATDGR